MHINRIQSFDSSGTFWLDSIRNIDNSDAITPIMWLFSSSHTGLCEDSLFFPPFSIDIQHGSWRQYLMQFLVGFSQTHRNRMRRPFYYYHQMWSYNRRYRKWCDLRNSCAQCVQTQSVHATSTLCVSKWFGFVPITRRHWTEHVNVADSIFIVRCTKYVHFISQQYAQQARANYRWIY